MKSEGEGNGEGREGRERGGRGGETVCSRNFLIILSPAILKCVVVVVVLHLHTQSAQRK